MSNDKFCNFWFNVLGIFFCSSLAGFANTYYISPSGSDEGDGNESSPWETIQRANNTIEPGDTVFLMPGTYYSPQFSKSGAAGLPITFKAYSGELNEDTSANTILAKVNKKVSIKGTTFNHNPTSIINRIVVYFHLVGHNFVTPP